VVSGEGERVGARWRLRCLLEAEGLRVLGLLPFPERGYRWSVYVLADEGVESVIRALRGVDVVRYRRLPGDPKQFVLTVDEPPPEHVRGTFGAWSRRRRHGRG
jgi:hypothetical protein